MQETADVEPPPWRDEAGQLTFQFRKVAHPGVNLPFELDLALLKLAKVDLRKQISSRQRDRLIAAIVRARAAARLRLPVSYDRRRLDDGFVAAAGLAMYWAEPEWRRGRRPRHFYMDLAGHARVLRNDMHNLCLEEQIADRAHDARSDTVDELRGLLEIREVG